MTATLAPPAPADDPAPRPADAEPAPPGGTEVTDRGQARLVDEAADVVGLGLVGLVALSGLGPAFGGARYLVVGGVGLLIGLIGAAVAARHRLRLWILALATVLVEVLVGACLVQADRAVALVLPSPSTVDDMVAGAFRGWVNLLTTTVPVGSAQDLLVVPWAAALVAGTAAMSISRRAGDRAWSLLALVPLLGLFMGGILMGTGRPAWDHQATTLVLLVLAWGARRQRAARAAGTARARRSRLVSGAAVMLLAGGAGLVLGRAEIVTGDGERYVLRDHVEPPVDLRRLASPLEGFRRYRTEERRDAVLFTVDGLEPGDRLRLATLDHYDGTIWHVQGGSTDEASSGFFQRVGQEVPVDEVGEPRTLTVEVGDYEDAWVPTIGATERVSFTGSRAGDLSSGFRYNTATDTAAEPAGLRPGDRYQLEVVVPDAHTDLDEGRGDPSVVVPEPASVDVVSERVAALAAAAGPEASALARVRAVERWLRSESEVSDPTLRAYFSDGELDPRAGTSTPPPASRPGHSIERMRVLFDDEGYVVGNEEQFASAMALIAHDLGVPARVVVGFAPEVSGDGQVEVIGSDISAWTEVAVAGVGWIPLLPTPTDREAPPDTTPEPIPPPDRYIVPPPTTVPKVALPSSGRSGSACTEDCDASGSSSPLLPAWVGTVALVVGPPLALLVGGTALVVGLKGIRRRRRRSLGSARGRVAAGWVDVCDLARDLGDVVPDRATRREVAVLLARPGVAELAQAADALLFGPEDIDPAMVDLYWHEADTARAAMVGDLSLLGRWKALVNPTSLRRTPTSDVRQGAFTAVVARVRSLRPGRLVPA